MLLALLCCSMPLSGCGSNDQARAPASIYKPIAWPGDEVDVTMQSGAAEYVTKGKIAYDSCTFRLDVLNNSGGE